MQVNVITKEEFQQWAESFTAQITAIIQGGGVSAQNSPTYNNDEAAAYLKVCKKTLQNYRDNGLIAFTQVGRKIIYTQVDLDDFVKKYTKGIFSKKTISL